ncbi:hypothetical protein F9U64_10615 [Gracilibacillus oryzae]|uniref:DUF3995 domain-containing protein n=1 Tax=Gracilibacillus oryzae TaxID=1672701 RepID=A0A7C8GT60_9BACI|nr:hypothetical protein [Gracilibacillus oryzae]KAB8135722.1 hypothetical protein F9U64_10615 [Gracilibacillus oryzae]
MDRLTLLGGTLIISGTILFGMVHLAIALYVPSVQGWETSEIFQQARNNILLNVPYFLSIIFIVGGFLLVLRKELKVFINFLTGGK